MDWASGLDLELQRFEEGEAPNEAYAGGEEYVFDINDGEETFSYVWIDNYYIVKDGKMVSCKTLSCRLSISDLLLYL